MPTIHLSTKTFLPTGLTFEAILARKAAISNLIGLTGRQYLGVQERRWKMGAEMIALEGFKVQKKSFHA